MDNRPTWLQFQIPRPNGDRLLRFRQFLQEHGLKTSTLEKRLQVIGKEDKIFETFERLKSEYIYSNLYATIIENLKAFGDAERNIERFLLFADKITMTAYIELEDSNADESKTFAAINHVIQMNNNLNKFQKCLFFKLCAIWVNESKRTISTNTKQDIFGKLCEDESWRIGNSIGYHIASNGFGGIWMHKKDELTTSSELPSKPKNMISQRKNKDITPIWWKKSDRLLGYLIDQLMMHDFIDKNTASNLAIKEHFVNKNKEPFGDSIKQNKSGAANMNKNKKPKGAETIDEIIANLREE